MRRQERYYLLVHHTYIAQFVLRHSNCIRWRGKVHSIEVRLRVL